MGSCLQSIFHTLSHLILKITLSGDTLMMRKIKLKRLTSFYFIIWLLICNVGTQHTNRSVAVKSNVPSSFSLLWTEPPFSHSLCSLPKEMFSRILFHIIDQSLVFSVNQVLVEEHIYYISEVSEDRLDLASTLREHAISLDRRDIQCWKQLERWCVKSYSIESNCNRFGIEKHYQRLR